MDSPRVVVALAAGLGSWSDSATKVISYVRPGVSPVILTAVSPAATLLLPLSAPPSPLQYTWYPVTGAVGVQETLILVGLACTALRSVGESTAVGEKRVLINMYSYVGLYTKIMFCSNYLYKTTGEMLHSLPTTVRLLVLAEGVLMLDTLNTYSPSSLPVTVSVWV